jgi:epoxyqueuosine reductase QueG
MEVVIMENAMITGEIEKYVENGKNNYIDKSIALSPEMIGLKMFDAPLVGFASADDEIFSKLKNKGVIGPHFKTPEEWVEGAKSVISIFLPFAKRIKDSNKIRPDWPSNEWFHARIEGQAFVEELCLFVKDYLEKNGFKALIPSMDGKFSVKSPYTDDRGSQEFFTSNWSERHAAYICGLGTFGLSKGLITARGVAGRIGSIVTSASFEPLKRLYSSITEYCNSCGLCAKNCPVRAISPETGKNHSICSAFLEQTRAKHKPWYGCGKCQVNVSCENKIPSAL